MEASCSGRCACNVVSRVWGTRRYVSHHVQQASKPVCKHGKSERHELKKGACNGSTKRKHKQISVAAQGTGEVAEVEELHGVRIVGDAKQRPQVQYLVKWKDGTPDTWQASCFLFSSKAVAFHFSEDS